MRSLHFGVLQDAVGAGGGSVVSDTGDGVFAVFPGAKAAVGAALTIQRATSAARAALGETAFATAWGAGRAMSLDQAMAAGIGAFGDEDPPRP